MKRFGLLTGLFLAASLLTTSVAQAAFISLTSLAVQVAVPSIGSAAKADEPPVEG